MGIIQRRPNGTYYCDGHYCGFTLAWFSCDPEEYGAEGMWVCLDCSASMYASAPLSPTPHDIAALAETRHRDPALALSIAEQSGKAHDQSLSVEEKEKTDERQSARNTNAR